MTVRKVWHNITQKCFLIIPRGHDVWNLMLHTSFIVCGLMLQSFVYVFPVFNGDVWYKRRKTRCKLRGAKFKSWFSQLCDLGQISECYWALPIVHTSWILNTSKVIMNVNILSTPKWWLPSTIKSIQFFLVFMYCFNKNFSRLTTETLWERGQKYGKRVEKFYFQHTFLFIPKWNAFIITIMCCFTPCCGHFQIEEEETYDVLES